MGYTFDDTPIEFLAATEEEMFSKLLYTAAKETFVEYLNKTSLNGCYLLFYIRRRKYQRLFWFMFIVMTVAFAIYVCATILMSFLRDPTVTTLDPQFHSVYDVPFPSVAICSSNKLSHEAIRGLALNISLRSPSAEESLEYWEHRLEMLSGLYNYDSIDFREATKLHYDLKRILGESFTTGQVLKNLAPKCEDLLVKCFWAGQLMSCQEQFELQIFKDGPCCVFNYHYMKSLDTRFYPNSTGPQNGLIVFLNSTSSDYFYTEDSAVGFNVKLFSTQRIPDVSLGGIEEFHVDPEEEVHAELYLLSQLTMEDVRIYGVHKRGCYFPYEHEKTGLDESECLLSCKIFFIESKCDCTPFYALKSDLISASAAPKEECSLQNLGCLEFYKRDLMDFLKCTDCFPLCSYDSYNYRKTANKLKHTFRSLTNKILLGEISDLPKDLSLVKIYYNTESGTRYRKNILYNWYHILSNIGGVIGICMGCSIINGIEIIYFGCVRLLGNFLKLKK